ncbi:myrosinase 1 [Orussus abietinus]|uniref:myrosinase 1 n=1 Tax=Orussus abietinus TaxID=222816 RepID=UPI0006260E88|nr:myrosinase 1 [Orussus abietinus]
MGLYSMLRSIVIAIFLFSEFGLINCDEDLQFPEGFVFGAATASYQVEGAWNVSDKSENQWDRFTHSGKSVIVGNATGDVACDSYHKYEEDVAILKQLGLQSYRFSLSWSRILPTGFPNKISKDGVAYYHRLIDALLSNGIEPMITIYHWDHPQTLEDYGGWTNELMVDWFADYARVVFQEFGQKVKLFATLNEPDSVCISAYARGIHAPGKVLNGIGDYLCMHNMLKAHARAYHIYKKDFEPTQKGEVGIVINVKGFYSKDTENEGAEEVSYQFKNGWQMDPIFSEHGDYPRLMRELVADKSKAGGFPRSRLPEFSREWVDYIRGSSDFLGVNYYTANVVEYGTVGPDPSYFRDQGVNEYFHPSWKPTASDWLYQVPQSFGKTLRRIARDYKNIPLYITENGMSDVGEMNDDHRIQYYHDYIKSMLLAMKEEGVNVKRYYLWSLLDNFEWHNGYSERFGIVHVDFEDPNRTRTLKKSAYWWQQVVKQRKLLSNVSVNRA